MRRQQVKFSQPFLVSVVFLVFPKPSDRKKQFVLDFFPRFQTAISTKHDKPLKLVVLVELHIGIAPQLLSSNRTTVASHTAHARLERERGMVWSSKRSFVMPLCGTSQTHRRPS